LKRITLIVGHYGSGKTEFSVNEVVRLKQKIEKVSILDMDIANPYFRSRERQQFMEDLGITVYFNSFGYDITEDLPAISACMKAPLENKEFTVVADVGGDNAGARVLNQFKKYFVDETDCEMLIVINANRPETDTFDGAMYHINTIQTETGLKVKGLINNTHMLRETTTEDILKGYRLCRQISEKIQVPIVYNTCVEELVPQLEQVKAAEGLDDLVIYPMKLYMRPTWLDRK
jgi:hypothetical protein